MKKLLALVSLLLVMGFSSPQSSSIFKLYTPQKNGVAFGTGFCSPGSTNLIMTAAHVVGDGMVVVDSNGDQYDDVKVVLKDETKDIGIIMVNKPLCELSKMEFSSKDAAPGDAVTLEGWGGGFTKRVTTRGIISSEVGYGGKADNLQLAQLNALYGHSGSPIINDQGKIVGMLVGVWDAEDKGDELDVIVPMSRLKKALK
jgi:serine protease Do